MTKGFTLCFLNSRDAEKEDNHRFIADIEDINSRYNIPEKILGIKLETLHRCYFQARTRGIESDKYLNILLDSYSNGDNNENH